MRLALPLAALLLFPLCLSAQQPPTAPMPDSSHIDPDGTAHITRVVPVPKTISPQAQHRLAEPQSDQSVPTTLAEGRAGTDKWQTATGKASALMFPVNIAESTLAGVPIRDVTPTDPTPLHPHSVLLNLHGGGFTVDSGSFTESIPIANLTHTRVVSVLYRMAPEHPFPAAVDDAIAVYRELLKTYQPAHIAIYGTSAGAILTAQVAVRLKQLHLPQPAALGIFSGLGDLSQAGDSMAMYGLNGLSGYLAPPTGKPLIPEYTGTTDPRDPVLSPIYADLHGLPPTLFLTSTRDLLLSGTTILHRAFLHAGIDARLIVFEALPHAFWNNLDLPETREAYDDMATFLNSQVNP